MKLSEFIDALLQRQRMHPHDDPEVVVKLSNSSVGGSAVAMVYAGFDWDNGKLFIKTKDKVVLATEVTIEGIEACGKDIDDSIQSSMYSGGYPRTRKACWLEGFVEGAKWGMTKLLKKNHPEE